MCTCGRGGGSSEDYNKQMRSRTLTERIKSRWSMELEEIHKKIKIKTGKINQTVYTCILTTGFLHKPNNYPGNQL